MLTKVRREVAYWRQLLQRVARDMEDSAKAERDPQRQRGSSAGHGACETGSTGACRKTGSSHDARPTSVAIDTTHGRRRLLRMPLVARRLHPDPQRRSVAEEGPEPHRELERRADLFRGVPLNRLARHAESERGGDRHTGVLEGLGEPH